MFVHNLWILDWLFPRDTFLEVAWWVKGKKCGWSLPDYHSKGLFQRTHKNVHDSVRPNMLAVVVLKHVLKLSWPLLSLKSHRPLCLSQQITTEMWWTWCCRTFDSFSRCAATTQSDHVERCCFGLSHSSHQLLEPLQVRHQTCGPFSEISLSASAAWDPEQELLCWVQSTPDT